MCLYILFFGRIHFYHWGCFMNSVISYLYRLILFNNPIERIYIILVHVKWMQSIRRKTIGHIRHFDEWNVGISTRFMLQLYHRSIRKYFDNICNWCKTIVLKNYCKKLRLNYAHLIKHRQNILMHYF